MRRLFLSSKEKKILHRLTLIGRSIAATQKGKHSSQKPGNNIEFKEYRSYTNGDEIRTIDWKVKARTNKLFIKTFHEDINTNGVILLDISLSMGMNLFDPRKNLSPKQIENRKADNRKYTKLEAAIEYAFILSQLYSLHGETLGFYSFTDEVEDSFKMNNSPNHYKQLNDYLASIQSQRKRTNYELVITKVVKDLPTKTAITILSDFYVEIEVLKKIHKIVSSKECQLNIVHVIDGRELNLDSSVSRAILVDSEKGHKMLFTKAMAKEYSDLAQKHCEQIKKMNNLKKTRVLPLKTNTSIFKQFTQYHI